MATDTSKVEFISYMEGISPKSPVQGAIFNDYFIAAVAALAEPEHHLAIKRLMLEEEVDPNGIYGFSLNKKGVWRLYYVDESLAMIEQESSGDGAEGARDSQHSQERSVQEREAHTFVLGASSRFSDLWVSLLEKAYAKSVGCYQKMGSKSTVAEALTDLTGAPSQTFFIKDLTQNDAYKQFICSPFEMSEKMPKSSKPSKLKFVTLEEFSKKQANVFVTNKSKGLYFDSLRSIELSGKLKNKDLEKIENVKIPQRMDDSISFLSGANNSIRVNPLDLTSHDLKAEMVHSMAFNGFDHLWDLFTNAKRENLVICAASISSLEIAQNHINECNKWIAKKRKKKIEGLEASGCKTQNHPNQESISEKLKLKPSTEYYEFSVEKFGIYPSTYYTVVNLLEVKRGFLGGEKVRLVRLRTCKGPEKWKGEWSQDCDNWIQVRNGARINTEDKDGGSFLMPFSQFCVWYSFACMSFYKPSYFHVGLLDKFSSNQIEVYEVSVEAEDEGDYFFMVSQTDLRERKRRRGILIFFDFRLT